MDVNTNKHQTNNTTYVITGVVVFIILTVIYIWYKSTTNRDELKVELESVKKNLEIANNKLTTCRPEDKLNLEINIKELNTKLNKYKELVYKVTQFADVYFNNKNNLSSTMKINIQKLNKALSKIDTDIFNLDTDDKKILDYLTIPNNNTDTFLKIVQDININEDDNFKVLVNELYKQIFTPVSDYKTSYVLNSNGSELNKYVSGTKNLAVIMGATGATTFEDLITNYQGMSSDYKNLTNIYKQLSTEKVVLDGNYINLQNSIYRTNTNISNNLSTPLSLDDLNNNVSIPNTNTLLSIPLSPSNTTTLNSSQLDDLIRYIRAASYLINRINTTSETTFSGILNNYNNQLNILSKYVQNVNRIPIRFLKDVILFNVNTGDDLDDYIGDNLPYKFRLTGPLSLLLDKWNNFDSCGSMYYSDPTYMLNFDTNITTKTINKDEGTVQYLLSDNVNFQTTKILSIKVLYMNNVYREIIDDNGKYNFNLGEQIIPENIIGKNLITLNSVYSNSNSADYWIGVMFTVLGSNAVDGVQLTGFINSQIVGNPGNTNIRFGSSQNSLIARPDFFDWSSFGYDSNNKTISLEKINPVPPQDNKPYGMLFRKVEVTKNISKGLYDVKSLKECFNTIDLTNPNNTNVIGFLLSRKPTIIKVNGIVPVDAKYSFYYVTEGSIVSRNSTKPLEWDFYLLPGKTNVNFDF